MVEVMVGALGRRVCGGAGEMIEPCPRVRVVGRPQRVPVLAQPVQDPRVVGRYGHELFSRPVPADRALQAAHETRADRTEVAWRHHEQRLGAVQHVHVRLLDQVFVIEVRGVADAPNQKIDALALGGARRVVAAHELDADVGPAGSGHAAFHDVLALRSIELRLLRWIFRQQHHHLIGQFARLADDPHMAIGNGIERSRKGDFLHADSRAINPR